ncbi:MAG: hypothetical protein JSV09_02735 [Thermoplasmata archaeon]|nr:MAG: hypothetical protein JSV09_02735 [Thermoplasmata archaeon]
MLKNYIIKPRVSKIRILGISAIVFILISTCFLFIPPDNTAKAQDTQIPPGWVKFNHHSHGLFDVHAENGTVMGTINESYNVFDISTGHTPEMIRDKFGNNGVFVHSPHVSSFEPYKEHWEAQRKYENEQWTTTTNFTLGEEFHLSGRHIGFVNITYFISEGDFYYFKDLRENISAQGGIMIINHPSYTWIGNPPLFLQPGYEFDAMEIYNGRVEPVGNPLFFPETDGREHYRNAVTQGRLLAVIGGSDAHNTQSGWQVYTVAEDPLGERNLDAVVRAIKNRRTYAAAYDMSVYDRSFFLECDVMGQIIETREISLEVFPPSANTYTVDLFRNNNTSPVKSWSLNGDVCLIYTIPESDARENAAYTFEIYEGGSAESSSVIAYSTAIWYQPVVDYNISLNEGWNLVSIPLIMQNTSVTEVLSSIAGDYDIAQWFDPILDTWKTYPGDDFELNNKIAFWIHMKRDSIQQNTGKMPFYTEIPLYASGTGWNMVGYPSMVDKSVMYAFKQLTGKYIAVQNYNSTDKNYPWKHYHVDKTKNDLDTLKTSNGLWVRVIEDCQWVVFN